MNRIKIALLSFLLIAVLLFNADYAPFNNKHRIFYDIESFREARMQLPKKYEPVPVWDNNEKTFVDMKQYVLSDSNEPEEYRMIQCLQYDLDGDGKPEEYILKDGYLTIKEGTNIVWQSPADWWVDCFFIGDATNSGNSELNLSVWKEGSFGPFKPFWIEEEDTSVKNHLFIFKFENNKFKPVWQSSNLDCPIRHAALIDLNGDGETELVVKEGIYTDPQRCKITLWKWNGWGFSKIVTASSVVKQYIIDK